MKDIFKNTKIHLTNTYEKDFIINLAKKEGYTVPTYQLESLYDNDYFFFNENAIGEKNLYCSIHEHTFKAYPSTEIHFNGCGIMLGPKPSCRVGEMPLQGSSKTSAGIINTSTSALYNPNVLISTTTNTFLQNDLIKKSGTTYFNSRPNYYIHTPPRELKIIKDDSLLGVLFEETSKPTLAIQLLK